MKKNYQCHFDFDEVSGGAIITEYDEDTPMVFVAEYDNIKIALGNILYNEINEGAGLSKARVTIIIEEL
jgi:hypothetical protein